MLEEALEYRRRGFSVIPMRMDTKKPAWHWTTFQTRIAAEPTIRKMFPDGSEHGIGVLFGAVSGGLASRDFDTMLAYDQWAAEHPDLASILPTVETSRGRHVYCQAAAGSLLAVREATGTVGGNGAIDFTDGELRADVGCYSVLPPSTHPSGSIYRWIIPLGDEIPTVDLLTCGFVPLSHATESTECAESTEGTEVYGGNGGLQRLPRVTDAIGRLVDCRTEKTLDASSLDTEAVQYAIAVSLPTGPGKRHQQVFVLARALQAIPELADADPRDLNPIVEQWHNAALPKITTPEFLETWIDFLRAWPRVHFPLGDEPMSALFSRAQEMEPPEVARQYEPAGLRLLVSLCRELQRIHGDDPFYLACRLAGELLGVDHSTANRWLFYLCTEDVLLEVEKGNQQKRRASRYRYLAGM